MVDAHQSIIGDVEAGEDTHNTRQILQDMETSEPLITGEVNSRVPRVSANDFPPLAALLIQFLSKYQRKSNESMDESQLQAFRAEEQDTDEIHVSHPQLITHLLISQGHMYLYRTPGCMRLIPHPNLSDLCDCGRCSSGRYLTCHLYNVG